MRAPGAWRLVPGAASLAAWAAMAWGGRGAMAPAFCGSTPWATPLPVALQFALLFTPPGKLAWGWALMIVAMMAPAIIAPLRHVRDRSFARRRARSMLLFAAGYAGAWMAAGLGVQVLAFLVRWAAIPPARLPLGLAVALLWQVSPAKQWSLNRCHRLPAIAAFGVAADRDALGYGLSDGGACVGSCWALMLPPLLAERGHIAGMVAITLFVLAERIERPVPPAWRWRWPTKALRAAVGQARMHWALAGR